MPEFDELVLSVRVDDQATGKLDQLKRSVGELGRVLINAQMSGFGGEAPILCSTRALPVLTPTGP
jgi:hypothetical protein